MTVIKATTIMLMAAASLSLQVSAFVAVPPCRLLTAARNPNTITELYLQVSEKPSRLDIEQAAGQLEPVDPLMVGRDHVNQHGFTSKTENECADYHTMAADPEQQKVLQKLTTKRNYALFLMEKAASIVDSFAGHNTHAHESVNYSQETRTKERLVILGAGWGSAALLQDIDNDRYDVTVISPRNFFLFTPMLAGAGLGTVDCRSITRPIREFNRQANYLEAAAESIDTKTKTISCYGIQCDDVCEISDFEVEYDRLVVAVGAKVNTFGIPGVEEYCSFLKEISDARQIRRKIINLFERANYPDLSTNQIEKLLTFAVIGAGPSGVELCGELRDFLEEDGPKYWKHLLKHVKIKLIEATDVVLRPFDKSLQEAAIESLTRQSSDLFDENMTEIILDKKVLEVTEEEIHLNDGDTIPYGLAVWAGGIGPRPITLQTIDAIGGLQTKAQQVARGKIAVDPWLRAVDGQAEIFALGDCVCTQGVCLPATAQVAAQQGEYLAHLLNTGNLGTKYDSGGLLLPPQVDPARAGLADRIASFAMGNDEFMAPFQFLDMGILAYTGGFNALAQVQLAPQEETRIKAKGKIGYSMWRSVYFLKQASTRNRWLLLQNWISTRLFGRDITQLE